MKRIALIHALSHSVGPINTAFASLWPEAVRMNVLDDSLSADLAKAGELDTAMDQRFATLAAYALSTGADGILFTCSAFGSCIERAAATYPEVPVLKPNEAMIEEIQHGTGKLGLIATFGPTLQSMPSEFGGKVELVCALALGALQALEQGNAAEHDQLIAAEAIKLRDQGCTRLALAQFSMARARAACQTATGLAVSTTVESAIRTIRKRLEVI
jgi:aspartate/glutamate racemase